MALLEVKDLRTYFKTRAGEVHAVYTIRDLARLLPSAWQEAVKQGRTMRFRRFLDKAFAEQGLTPRVAGEVESVPALFRLLRAKLGATVLPRSAADALFPDADFRMRRLVDPDLHVKFGLCTADHEPMSEAAAAVLILLREMIKNQLLARYGTDAA